MSLNRRLPPIRQDQFAMVPRADVPRSKFHTRHSHKSTFDADKLYPIFVDEVLPGDDIRGKLTLFIRMATPIFPIMDDLTCETFFFFVPNRLVWDNWVKMMGERAAPSDSIAFLVPTLPSGATGFVVDELADHFGLPVAGDLSGGAISVNALYFRAYNLIWNEWFRPQDIQGSLAVPTDDGPDDITTDGYFIRYRYKRHDYFTSALPWPVKANAVPTIPIGTSAPVRTGGTDLVTGTQVGLRTLLAASGGAPGTFQMGTNAGAVSINTTAFAGGAPSAIYPSNLYADLTQATGATLNAIRLAVATQQLLEKDARGGTRYTELLRNHFGVHPQDSRLQRPEYIGGGKHNFHTQAIPQTSASAVTGSTTALGSLGASATGAGQHEFSYAATEHGMIIGLINVTGNLTYQRGVHRRWTRSTRYDFYWPTFAFLGEQAIRNDEIFATGVGATDAGTFGYQERWAEYRYRQSQITGKFRSTPAAGSLDDWHLAQDFASAPALNEAFLRMATPISRVVAAGVAANNQQFLMDSVFEISNTRPLPLRSVPGLARF